MSQHCPRCKSGTVVDMSVRYGIKACSCINCGAFNEVGSLRESIDRQMTRQTPKSVERRKQQNVTA
jgi:Zn ribbon nucleic-acid-binding protein